MPSTAKSSARTRRTIMRSSTISAGQIRNGPNTLGSLNAAERAVAGGEPIMRVRKGVEIAADAEDCGEHGGEHVGRAQGDQPRHGVLGEQTAEDHRRERQIKRGGGVLHGLVPGRHVEQRQQAADVPGQQQHEQRQQTALEAHARDQAGERQRAHQEVMRRRLDDGDRARQHRDVKHHQQQPLAQIGVGGGRGRRPASAAARIAMSRAEINRRSRS